MQLVLYSRILNSFGLAADYCKRAFVWLVDTLTALRLGISDGRRLMRNYETLSRLSVDDLAKRGLTRDEIGQAALHELKRGRAR